MLWALMQDTCSSPLHSGCIAASPALAHGAVQWHSLHGDQVHVEVRQRTLASEVPVSLVFNGIAHAVMMATPQNLEEFALGFALTEGILDNAADCHGIEVSTVADCAAGLPEGMHGIQVQLEISSRSFARLKGLRRNMAGRTGCGVCGVESFAALDLSVAALAPRPWIEQVDLPVVLRAMDLLSDKQVLNVAAGALHAAGWAALDGSLREVFEDVGRHNALDKLMGHRARSGRLDEPGFVILSSRGSHELVRKCAKLGIAAMATLAAPTSLGVHLAERTGMRLWGSCRGSKGILFVSGSAAQ